MACATGDIHNVKKFIACGKNICADQKRIYRLNYGDWHYEQHITAAERAKQNEHYDVAELVEKYNSDPIKTTTIIRTEIGWISNEANLFGLIVLISDDYLLITNVKVSHN